MKKTLLTLAATIAIATSAMADSKQTMVDSVATIPGVMMSAWIDADPSNLQYMVFFTNPYAGHNFKKMGNLLCTGGQANFGVEAGYTISFWDPKNKVQVGEFKCV